MKALQASVLMLCAALGFSHILFLFGDLFPILYAQAYRITTLAEAEIIMPAPSRFAVHYAWLFPLLLFVVWLVFLLAVSHGAWRTSEFLICGLCVQGLVVWAAAFCFFFDAFTGGMCLHHLPEFERERFLSAGFGVFPTTLTALLVPIVVVALSGVFGKGKEESARAAANAGRGGTEP
ncbi:MAG: hypothetical protein GX595_04800 [Lentisphaerae bacterium]|nr:hypothetical protein [Lentisphaerota bacterium]